MEVEEDKTMEGGEEEKVWQGCVFKREREEGRGWEGKKREQRRCVKRRGICGGLCGGEEEEVMKGGGGDGKRRRWEVKREEKVG